MILELDSCLHCLLPDFKLLVHFQRLPLEQNDASPLLTLAYCIISNF